MSGQLSFATAYPRQPRMVLVAAFLLLFILTCGATVYRDVRNQMNAWHLLPRPERLTELYFTTPNNLPIAYTVDMPEPVSFTVHNLEYATTTYHYLVIEQSGTTTESHVLTSGTFTLLRDRFETTQLNVMPYDLGKNVRIIVELTNINESISYHVERTS